MHFFKSLLIFVTTIGITHAMDFAGLEIAQSAPLTQWPAEFYAEVFPGHVHPFVKSGELHKVKKIALNGTKEKATKLSIENKETYDWVNALLWSEEHLLSKPFETWTVEDLKKLNGCLTRLVTNGTGAFRDNSGSVVWTLRPLTPEENLKQHDILRKLEDSSVTDEEMVWFRTVNHIFPSADKIPSYLEETLKMAKKAVIQYKKSPARIASHDIINIACWVHFEIVKIHAWPEANKRTGRLVMSILLAQFGYTPPFFPDRQAYINCFLKHLQNPTAVPLQTLVSALLKKRS